STGLGLRARGKRLLHTARIQSLLRRYRARSVAAADGNARDIAGLIQRLVPAGGIYLNVGHDNLTDDVMTGIADAGLIRAVLLHDTIPLDFPEFARPGTPAKFQLKLQAAKQADLLVFNSAHTGQRVAHHLGSLHPNTCVAPLGIEPHGGAARSSPHPYFLCLGTIEPRKNHAMLLDIWDGLHGAPPPIPLRIAGRRGWRNKAVFERLDTGGTMGRTVFEDAAPDDATLSDLVKGACAVLLPSYAEGYGLPVAEALAAGVPVIASDLPALRSVGQDVPEWLPPDAPDRWRETLIDYAEQPSQAKQAQLQRLSAWSPPTWDAHFAIVENALETILVQVRQRA
ncbi:MAG: glycosyltransferase family 1 protein, partial [Pseudomonadota bacterium]